MCSVEESAMELTAPDLQSGQLALNWSQVSMQSMWKGWEQPGSSFSLSSLWNSLKQMAHSRKDAIFSPAEKVTTGMERMADVSRPRDSVERAWMTGGMCRRLRWRREAKRLEWRSQLRRHLTTKR